MKKVTETLGCKEKVTTFAPATTATLLERLKGITGIRKGGVTIRMRLWVDRDVLKKKFKKSLD